MCYPFGHHISIYENKDSYNNKKVTFNTQSGLEDKIDRLTVMMSQLTTKDQGLIKQFFKPKIYHSRGRD